MDFQAKKEELEQAFLRLKELKERAEFNLSAINLELQQLSGKLVLLGEILSEKSKPVEQPKE